MTFTEGMVLKLFKTDSRPNFRDVYVLFVNARINLMEKSSSTTRRYSPVKFPSDLFSDVCRYIAVFVPDISPLSTLKIRITVHECKYSCTLLRLV